MVKSNEIIGTTEHLML